jgi:hypothetical protein
MPIKFKSKIILFEIETVYGTDPAPAGSTNAMLMVDVSLTPMEGEDESRNLEQPYLAGQPLIPVGKRVRLRGKVELVPSGTAGTAPKWGPLLRACACSQTIVSETSVTYAPITDGHESGTLYFWMGGTRHTALGCRGTATLRFTAQKIPYIEFDLVGLYAQPTEEARDTPTLSGFQKPVIVTDANTPTFTVNAVDLVMREASLALNNAVEFRGLVGSESIIIPDRSDLFAFRVEAKPVSGGGSFNPYALADAQTAVAVSLVHGTVAGKIATLAIPAMQLKRPAGYEEAQNIAEWPLEGIPLPTSGNDQWSLALT